jgi:site-specific DNA-adenine methylase
MRYLGGKSKTAKMIAGVIQPRGLWWEPFCGGLSVSVQLAAYGPGIVSDANEALISLYKGVREGWDPPTEATEDEWRDARGLPDSDPRKAFFGVGCSFSGMWFRSTAVAALRLWSPRDKGWLLNDPVGAARRSLLRDVPRLAGCEIKCLDFLTCDPPEVEVIYCDPPYEGTAGYKAVGPFDHKAFWRRCQALAQRSRVFVSEYACPVPHEEVWSRPSGCIVSRSGSGLDPRAPKRSNRVERLFGVLPL